MRRLPLLALLLAGCAGTASHVLVGDPRTPVDPAEVQIYLQPPSRYDEIAIVTADNRGSWQWSAQGASDAALERLKTEAASLGANGITGLMIGSGWSGSTAALGLGTGFGSYGWGSGWSGPGYGLGAAVGVPAPARSISALAIRVIAP
jgi:hypothetical protein